jgi:hypothetical protein
MGRRLARRNIRSQRRAEFATRAAIGIAIGWGLGEYVMLANLRGATWTWSLAILVAVSHCGWRLGLSRCQGSGHIQPADILRHSL